MNLRNWETKAQFQIMLFCLLQEHFFSLAASWPNPGRNADWTTAFESSMQQMLESWRSQAKWHLDSLIYEVKSKCRTTRQWSNLLHRRPTTTPSKNGNWQFAQEWWKLEAHIPASYLHARHGDMNDVSTVNTAQLYTFSNTQQLCILFWFIFPHYNFTLYWWWGPHRQTDRQMTQWMTPTTAAKSSDIGTVSVDS